MNIRPLEPGCLAIITKGHPENIGAEVTCKKFMGQVFNDIDGDTKEYWAVDAREPIICNDVYTGKRVREKKLCIEKSCLLRIDGYKETEKEQEREHAPRIDS